MLVCSIGECWASKDMEVGNAGLALEAAVIGSCWVSTTLVSKMFGRDDIEDLNCISMCVMEEGASKSCIVEENLGSVVDFMPFGFADTVHFLMFRGCSINFDSSDVHSEMNLAKVKVVPASVRMNLTD